MTHSLVVDAEDLLKEIKELAEKDRLHEEREEELEGEVYELNASLSYEAEKVEAYTKHKTLENLFAALCKKYDTDTLEVNFRKDGWWGVSIGGCGDEGTTILLAASDLLE